MSASALDDLTARLSRLLDAEVSGLTRLTGGASRETYRLTAGGRPLILQRQRPGADRSMAVEAAVLRAAHEGGVPVPTLVANSDDPADVGAAYMVLAAIDGETIARKIQRDEPYDVARTLLAAQFGEAAARLHQIDPACVDGLVDSDQVAQQYDLLDLFGQPHPTFEVALRWLDHHRPPTRRTAIVHGDLRLGNIIVGADGLRAVLDWELAHLGDPMEDLGWLCVKAWRFGGSQPVAGIGSYDDLFTAYERVSGTAVDAEAVRWWEILGTVKWGIICIMQANTHLSGAVRSHELAAIGRRVCENEWDVLAALEGML